MTISEDDFMSDSASDFEDPDVESDEYVDEVEERAPKKAKVTPPPKEVKKAPAKPRKTPAKPKETPAKPKKAPEKATNKTLDQFMKPQPESSTTASSDRDIVMTEVDAPVTESASDPKKTVKSVNKGDYEERTIEEIYKKKTQLEHILLRPDTYIGSVEADEQEMWVFDSDEDMIKRKKIKYVPGLYKIVDEILVNAADNKIRDPSMTQIKVIINRAENLISIYNNGRGIPITMHKEENVYVPELIFGHLLTSSNYDDNEKKVTGGRNGYGAKLCNIFSTEFIVETGDKERELKYRQVFKDNMTNKGKPKVTKNAKGDEFTRITFKPDLSKFNMTEMDEDFEALIKKRVYDLAGTVDGVAVYLNGTKIPVKNFQKYVDLYTKTMEIRNADGKKPIIHDTQSSDRWQVSFAVSDGQFHQVSFVNSICTAKGGNHVNHVVDQIVKALQPEVQRKCGSKNVKPFTIRSHIAIFINCLIENPAFDSQTKENMTLRQSAFGSSYKLGEKFLQQISKSGLVDNIIKSFKMKEEEQMAKADGGKMSRRLKIPKLEDANMAGLRPHNKKCTLILTEGDSAKALVLSGLSVVGRDHYGVFPLRGKLLNVRDASNSQIMNNNEITYIKQILGLKHGQNYTGVEELRYGKLMIMTDQDHDGSHIKGLILNFIDEMFPSLLDIPGFLLEFITPIIKCTNKRRTKEVVSFFTIPEYEAWAVDNNRNNEWEPKYFKGLGTSSRKDAQEYFSSLDVHMKEFHVPDTEDRSLINMAFNKKKVADRKEWLTNYSPDTFIDHSVNKIKISDFVNRELMLFSMADNIRSIPSVVDGFKPTQRKVLYGTAKRSQKGEMKVSQLANYVASETKYHHGETSVQTTIIGMAQEFVGSNNINLLVPSGQFGTRHEGGKAAASPRYLFTKLSKITRHIFHPEDDDVLNYLIEEGKSIEPKWYVPVIPMVLVNGADGIGTGWSTSIPNYNPEDIIDNLLRMMDGEELVTMKPWFRGFTGEIVPSPTPGRYNCNGIADVTDDGNIKVTELPVRQWTDGFRDHLDLLRDPKDKKVDLNIIDYSNNSTDVAIEFTIQLEHKDLIKAEDIGVLKAFKIASSIATTNIVCFDKDDKLKRYNNAEEVLTEFYPLRLEYYQKRKDHLLRVLEDEFARLDNKARFIELVINKELVYVNCKEEDVIADFNKHGLKRMYPLKKRSVLATEDEEENPDANDGSGFEYLFNINVRGFTTQKVTELRKQREAKKSEIEIISATTPKQIWRKDLEIIQAHWREIVREDTEIASNAKPLKSSKVTKRKRGPAKKKAPKKEETE